MYNNHSPPVLPPSLPPSLRFPRPRPLVLVLLLLLQISHMLTPGDALVADKVWVAAFVSNGGRNDGQHRGVYRCECDGAGVCRDQLGQHSCREDAQ